MEKTTTHKAYHKITQTTAVCSNNNNNNNNNNHDNVYGAVTVAQRHCKSSTGSYGKYGTAPSGRRHSDQAKRPGLSVRL